MGDADSTYNFEHAPRFTDELLKGHELVVGNRFLGGVERVQCHSQTSTLETPFCHLLPANCLIQILETSIVD